MINETNQLSEREREVLRLVAAGQSNQQIAQSLGISINTVKVHLRNVFGKIGVASRTEATMYAVRAGIVAVERANEALAESEAGDAPVRSAADIQDTSVTTEEPSPSPSVSLANETAEMSDRSILHTLQTTDAVPERDRSVVAASVPADQAHNEFTHRQSADSVPWTETFNRTSRRRTIRTFLMVGIAIVCVVAVAQVLGVFTIAGISDGAVNAPQVSGDEARWRNLPNIRTARAAFGATTIGDQIFVIAGENTTGILSSVEQFDTRSGTWRNLSDKPTAVADVRAAVLGGDIYVPGGRTSTQQSDVTSVVEKYDPQSQTWEQVADLPAPRSGYALAVVEGTLYVFGGWDGTSYRKEVFEYDPDSDTWTTRSEMPTARAYMDAGVVDDNIYVIGGENESGPLTVNEVYTPALEGGRAWSSRASLPEARSHFSLVVASTIVHIIGGSGGDLQPVKYNARSDSWQYFSAPPQPVASQAGAVLLDETAITVGGKADSDTYSSEVQGYQALFTIFSPSEY